MNLSRTARTTYEFNITLSEPEVKWLLATLDPVTMKGKHSIPQIAWGFYEEFVRELRGRYAPAGRGWGEEA